MSDDNNQQAPDLMALYSQASAWTLDKVKGAVSQLDADTVCDGWNVRTVMDHVLETEQYFVSKARGEDLPRPSSETPGKFVGDDPVDDFTRSRQETIDTFGQPGVIERTGPMLGIAFADQLLHGWDLAKATGQDTTMPDGLAEAAYAMIHGRFTDEQRKGTFKPELKVADTAPIQAKLLAYTGRDPSV